MKNERLNIELQAASLKLQDLSLKTASSFLRLLIIDTKACSL
jgi:hypothetical protein